MVATISVALSSLLDNSRLKPWLQFFHRVLKKPSQNMFFCGMNPTLCCWYIFLFFGEKCVCIYRINTYVFYTWMQNCIYTYCTTFARLVPSLKWLSTLENWQMPFASAAVHSQQWKVENMESTSVGRVLPCGIYQPNHVNKNWCDPSTTTEIGLKVQIEITRICKSKRNMLNCLGIVTWKFIIKSSMDKINWQFLFLFNHQQKGWFETCT